MSHRLWLLVEWLGDNDMFSSYGVVNSDSIMGDVGDKTNFDIGKIVFVPSKHNKCSKRGKILRTSERKRTVKELKTLLERQDSQMKNVLKLCINTLKDMKTNSMILDPQSNRAGDTESSSDDDDENKQDLNFSKLTNKFTSNRSRLSANRYQKQPGSTQTSFNSIRAFMSSTPFTESSKLTFDQATQTDESVDPNVEKVEHLENLLKRLYQQFLSLIGETREHEIQPTLPVEYSETEISEMDQQIHQSEEATIREVSATEALGNPSHGNISHENTSHANILDANTIPADISEHKGNQAKRLCIRRASAQTTNTGLPNPDLEDPDADMIPIGGGTTKLPVTVINAIDWSSYTTATRQLLKAIFPRKVLATHSLTGKQSPAFTNKPPKKALDPKIVNDIVDTVSEICGVSKRTVRSCITTKCTDEAKLYRNRQLYKQNNESRENQENITPSPPSSNEIVTKKEFN